MNERQVHKFVQRYLETTNCHIIEKSPAHFLVKLSPRADRDLTNRPYYWSFVDRTGAEPETMSMLLVTDKLKYDERLAAGETDGTQASAGGGNPGSIAPAALGAAGGVAAAADAALGRSFGFVHGKLNAVGRVPREDLYFGSRRLEQLFESSKLGGSYVCLFQEPEKRSAHPLQSTAYTAWLGVNMKVEFVCDMKREEIHSFGVSLATGQCVERFYDSLTQCRMTPKLPPNIHTAKNALSLNKAATIAEQTLERKLRTYDYSWAQAAAARLADELATIRHYYEPLISSLEDENRTLIIEQFERRQEEIRWQYEPRVTASAINCGIFYLEGIG
ncbi:YqhG family protein [Paenibacillus sp. sptzw28]|uniref:YqhG family protein n=1 Tax=Paenibacillus sp. sptzw28 TaxID=715179 RepID=UPI001C6F0C18|nr:YqhG family protein [Paenibacillus sp. sptzw28]QYR23552.1 YqhG family protein [Paenibacillus sp. sptzw28]